MTYDPILQEIHEVREKIWRECDGDPKKFSARLRKVQEQYSDRVVDLDAWKRERREDAATQQS